MPAARTMVARKVSTAAIPYEQMGITHQMKSFFTQKGVPVDAYPIVFITLFMASAGTFMLSKHIKEDHDHLRWMPRQGGYEFRLPAEKL
ncbi:hypothetical protein L202_07612 [Cryptococcus amylolentus CBS 6039]|uniref:Uncharacterized protein n=3 Tax=Cryptococcus TaxID=5206 RepID=A0A1E3HCU3_9TREE|nr:hypothetical protein L202_07612 [Cryptococcus amylolentus CBS 6039]ODN74160.1 hypothetical protein L202_07612 [Cryptococcus amylolentus CBS 6039]ODO00064.1 hypothetical protein I350_06688 [Cryptococcus amylolentus CBS 6273]